MSMSMSMMMMMMFQQLLRVVVVGVLLLSFSTTTTCCCSALALSGTGGAGGGSSNNNNNNNNNSISSSKQPQPKIIPITVLSGFLGSGKTTLLQNMLQNKQGLKIGVVVNDVASVNIDSKLVAQRGSGSGSGSSGSSGGSSDDTTTSNTMVQADGMVELQNGCACCSLSDELLTSVANLVTLSDLRAQSSGEEEENAGSSSGFDHIVIELSGVADPKAIRAKFQEATFNQMPLMERVQLDTMVSLIDCSTFESHFQSTQLATRTEMPELFINNDENTDDEMVLEDWMKDLPPKLLETVLASMRQDQDRDDMNGGEPGGVADLLTSQTETADLVILNKQDLLRRILPKNENDNDDNDNGATGTTTSTTTELARLKEIVSALNPRAKVLTTSFGQVDLQQVLGVAGGLGVAMAGAVDDHRDYVLAATTTTTTTTTRRAAAASATKEKDCIDADCTDPTHDHSHSHDHGAAAAATDAPCAKPECTDPTHDHSHSHDHGAATTDAACTEPTTCTDPTHDHSHSHDHGAAAACVEPTTCTDPTHDHSHSHDHGAAATDATDSACAEPECTDPTHDHSHSHDHGAAATDAACAEPECTDPTHDHSHSHDHGAATACAEPTTCTDPTHDHSHSHDHGAATTAAACVESECTDPTHDHSHSHNHGRGASSSSADAATATATFVGIGSFVYRARRPFHPGRLVSFLRHLPVVRGIPPPPMNEEQDQDDTDTESSVITISKETQATLKQCLRSKGFVWCANSHTDALYWSHAGATFELSCLGQWWATLPRDQWPPGVEEYVLRDFDWVDHNDDDDDDDDDYDDEDNGSSSSVGDRRQEIVFIGPTLGEGAAQRIVTESLDQCLLNDSEYKEYQAIVKKKNKNKNKDSGGSGATAENQLRARFANVLESKYVTY